MLGVEFVGQVALNTAILLAAVDKIPAPSAELHIESLGEPEPGYDRYWWWEVRHLHTGRAWKVMTARAYRGCFTGFEFEPI